MMATYNKSISSSQSARVNKLFDDLNDMTTPKLPPVEVVADTKDIVGFPYNWRDATIDKLRPDYIILFFTGMIFRSRLVPSAPHNSTNVASSLNAFLTLIEFIREKFARYKQHSDDPQFWVRAETCEYIDDLDTFVNNALIPVPPWFISHWVRFFPQVRWNYPMLLDHMLQFITHMHPKFQVVHITIDANLDALIKKESLKRKIAGIKEQIQNLKIAQRKASMQNNPIPLRDLSAQITAAETNLNETQEKLWNLTPPTFPNDSQEQFELAHATSALGPAMDDDIVHCCNDGSEPEMVGEVLVTTDHAQNTAISTGTEETSSVTIEHPMSTDYIHETQSDLTHKYPALTDRWIRFWRYPIDRSLARGQLLDTLNLPYDAIVANWDSPNSLPFRNHVFYAGGMEVKFQWNLAKTQQCYVQFGAVPHLLQRDRIAELQTPWTISQQPGCFLNGHATNSTELSLPFLSHHPMIPIRPNTTAMHLYQASINVMAMTAFEHGIGDTGYAEIVGYFKFSKDLQFFGQHGTIDTIPAPLSLPTVTAHACMMAGVAAIGSGLLSSVTGTLVSSANSIVNVAVKTASRKLTGAVESTLSQAIPNKRNNRDKPTDHAQSTFFQTTTTNIASGSGRFNADSLRLTETATETQPEFLMGQESFYQFAQLARIFGFVNSVRVSKSMGSGTELARFYIQPGRSSSYFNNLFSVNNNYAPVDAVQFFFRAFHGDMEFKFVPVNNGFTTCRITVVYCPPGVFLNYSQISNFYSRTFDIGPDLESQQTFTQTVPYIQNALNFPLVTDSNAALVFGRMFLFLETPLASPEGVADGFDLLIYKRAGPNFRFSIPHPSSHMILGGAGGGEGPNPPLPPAITFRRVNLFVVAQSTGAADRLFTIRTTSTTGPIIDTFLLTAAAPSHTFNVGRVGSGPSHVRFDDFLWTQTGSTAAQYPTIVSRLITPGGLNDVFSQFSMVDIHSARNILSEWNFPSNVPFNTFVIPLDISGSNWPTVAAIELPFETVTASACMMASADSRMDPHGLDSFVPSCNPIIEALQGESFDNIQDNLRRFEHFTSFQIAAPNSLNQKVKIWSILCNTGASSLRSELTDLQRRNKVTMCADWFRFARTGMRYLIDVNYTEPGTLYYRHVPFVNSPPLTIAAQSQQGIYDASGYGENVHSLQQNPVFPLEVPMYTVGSALINASYLLTNELYTNFASNLGVIEIYWKGPSSNLSFDIKRALTDDSQFFGFNGIPTLEPFLPYTLQQFQRTPALIGQNNDDDPDEAIHACLNLLGPELQGEATTFFAKAGKLVESMQGFLTDLSESERPSQVLTTIILQVGQIISHPSLSSFAMSITQVLVSMNIVKISMLSSLSSLLGRYFDKIGIMKNTCKIAVPVASTSTHMTSAIGEDMEEAAELSAVLISGVASFFGHGQKKGIGKFEGFVCAFTSASTFYQRVLEFLKTLFNYLRRATVFVCSKLFPDSRLLTYLQDDGEERIRFFVDTARVLSDPTIYGQLSQNADAIACVYLMVNDGDQIATKLAESKARNTKIGSLVLRHLNDLKKVRDKLATLAGIPNAKFDPFCYYIHGASSIGKSVLLEEISTRLAVDLGIQYEGKPIYVVPTDKYWESYQQHPIIHFDDFHRVQPAEVTETDCARLCGLKGSADFVIPKAFSDKGVVSTAKIIGCASNHDYPHVQGMNREVVYNRRNLFYECRLTPGLLQNCETHNDGCRLHCIHCRSMEANVPVLRDYAHLQFQRRDPVLSTVRYGEWISFKDFYEQVRSTASLYFPAEEAAVARRVAQSLTLSSTAYIARRNNEPIPANSTYMTPQMPFGELEGVIELAKVGEIVAKLGGSMSQARRIALPPNPLIPHPEDQPALATRFGVGAMIDRIEAAFYGPRGVVDDNASSVVFAANPNMYKKCYHDQITLDCPMVFTPDSLVITWPDHLGPDGKMLTNQKCFNSCVWPEQENDHVERWVARRVAGESGEPLPEGLPRRFDTTDYVAAAMEHSINDNRKEPWYAVLNNINWSTAAASGVLGGLIGAICWWAEARREAKSETIPDEQNEVIVEESLEDEKLISEFYKSAPVSSEGLISPDEEKIADLQEPPQHPCLMVSADVKTLFMKTNGKKVHTKVPLRGPAKPPQTSAGISACNNELKALEKCYNQSIFRVEYGKQFHGLWLAIHDGIYITTFHSIARLIRTVAAEIKKLKLAGKTNEEVCEEILIKLWKTNANGTSSSIMYKWVDVVMQNYQKFNVMYDGSDMCILRFKIPHFTTQNVKQYLIKRAVTSSLSNDDKLLIYNSVDKQAVAKVSRADDVNVTIRIPNDEATLFCGNLNGADLILKMNGYRTTNPWPNDYLTKCGTILVDRHTCRIIGIMSAGSVKFCHFNALVNEMVADAGLLENIRTKNDVMVQLEDKTVMAMNELPDEITERKMTIPKMVVHQSVKTTIRKSVCHEVFGEVKRVPCIMGTPDDPTGLKAIVRGLQNYVPHKPFPEKDIAAVYEDLRNLYTTQCVPIIPVVSKRSRIEGIEGVSHNDVNHIPKLKMSTSPGIPFSFRSDTAKKSDLVEFNPERTKVVALHPDLIKMLATEEQMMREGIVPFTIYQIALKDERLQWLKRENVRIIQGSPLSLTIATRQYLMDFNYAFQCSRENLEHRVGINPDSDEWNVLALKLLEKGNYICVGDYSKYGPRLLTQFVEMAYDIMNDWYDIHGAPKGDRDVRNILKKRVVNSKNMAGAQIFTLNCGSPSGATNTVVINSMCNQMYIRCAWIGIMRELSPSHVGLHHFNKNVEFVCYGDDVIFSVTEDFIRLFNNETLHQFFARYDVKYTDVRKDGSIRPFCSITDATFLKNGFKWYGETSLPGGVWIVQPNIDDVLDTTNWIRKPKGMPEPTELPTAFVDAAHVNCSDSLRKMWFYGREVFDEFKAAQREFWTNFELDGKRWVPPSFDFDALQLELGYPLPSGNIEYSFEGKLDEYKIKYGYAMPDSQIQQQKQIVEPGASPNIKNSMCLKPLILIDNSQSEGNLIPFPLWGQSPAASDNQVNIVIDSTDPEELTTASKCTKFFWPRKLVIDPTPNGLEVRTLVNDKADVA
jgi:hypothetical protein